VSGWGWCGSAHVTALKKRDPQRFEQAQRDIEKLIECAERGEIELAYVDEAGFAQAHPNRNAWTPRGMQHQIEAKRGKRLNVVGALLHSGRLLAVSLWHTMTAPLFSAFLSMLLKTVAKPITVILDNASVHTARAIQHELVWLQEQGLTLYFLPPYSPELNRIEKLWYLIKHKWLTFKARDPETLEEDVNHVLDNVGSIYRVNSA
jgi:transposase